MDRRGLVLMAVLGLVSGSQVMAAEPPIALWGVYRCAPDSPGSCERITETETDVETLMKRYGTRWSLTGPGVAGSPACTPPQCGEQLRSACGTSAGRVLGVFVQPQKNLIQVRVWLYDIATQKLAVHDNFCPECDITTAVKDNVKTLLTTPKFDGYRTASPSYCEPNAPLRTSALNRPRGRVAIVVVNNNKKTPKNWLKDLSSDLKLRLQDGNRETIGVTQVLTKPSLDDLRKYLEGDKRNQVLTIEGMEKVSLFDGLTEKIAEGPEIACDGCESKKYIDRLKQIAGSLLERCFDSECATTTAQSKPPAESCVAFAEPSPLSTLAVTNPPAGPARRIDPQLARLTKGALWGLVGAGAATTIGLALANSFGRENRDVTGTDKAGNSFSAQAVPFDNVYGKAALTATGFTVAMLGVAIPITIGVVRAERPSEPPRAQVAQSLGIQCFK